MTSCHRLSRYAALLLGFAALGASAPQQPVQAEDRALVPIGRAKFCVTKGAIDETGNSRLEVKVPEMRAVVASPTDQAAEVKLTYLGPTTKDKPLRSGEMRRQFGLKLRAQNGCNLVYAMWRIEPKSELVVSYKSNPGMTTNAQCGTHGYHTLKPTRDLKAPRLEEGKEHTLRAEISGNEMKVAIDGKTVWQGLLAPEALAVDGPVGVRSDNGRFKFELFARPATGDAESTPCHAADEDE